MTTVHTLASGSSGNALLLCSDTTRILLDTGISCRRITTAQFLKTGCWKAFTLIRIPV